jgi:hypothetical protein
MPRRADAEVAHSIEERTLERLARDHQARQAERAAAVRSIPMRSLWKISLQGACRLIPPAE